MAELSNTRNILITGSSGLLGSALVRRCEAEGIDYIAHTRQDFDLMDGENSFEYFREMKEAYGVDTIIHTAAKVGGVLKNTLEQEAMFLDNVQINNNVLKSAADLKIPNFVNILSSCLFPSNAKYPLTLDQIYDGEPHDSQKGYAYSKRLSYEFVRYYRNVFGTNWYNVIPTNIFGINDNFHPEDSHVIPALIRKAAAAAENDKDFEIWGDGLSYRQFIDSDDLAKIIIQSLDNWRYKDTLFAANPKEYQIKEIVLIIAKIFNIPEERIIFDRTKPSGRRRMATVSDVDEYFEFNPLEASLRKASTWYLENIKNVRGN